MNHARLLGALAVSTLGSTSALAQSDIHPDNKFCWGENVGFMNWRDAGTPSGAQGVRLSSPHSPTFISGLVWGENIGWINLGNVPADFYQYVNVNNTDYGVNVDPAGNLSGFGWGENVGWINFGGGALAVPAQPARFDEANQRFRGYAWGPNIGWINLDHATDFVAVFCPADFNQDGFVDPLDYNAYINAFEAADPAADFNRDGFVDPLDYNAYINDFEAGC